MDGGLVPLPEDASSIKVFVGDDEAPAPKAESTPPPALPTRQAAANVATKVQIEEDKHTAVKVFIARQDELQNELKEIAAAVVKANDELAQASDEVVQALKALDDARKAAGRPMPPPADEQEAE